VAGKGLCLKSPLNRPPFSLLQGGLSSALLGGFLYRTTGATATPWVRELVPDNCPMELFFRKKNSPFSVPSQAYFRFQLSSFFLRTKQAPISPPREPRFTLKGKPKIFSYSSCFIDSTRFLLEKVRPHFDISTCRYPPPFSVLPCTLFLIILSAGMRTYSLNYAPA